MVAGKQTMNKVPTSLITLQTGSSNTRYTQTRPDNEVKGMVVYIQCVDEGVQVQVIRTRVIENECVECGNLVLMAGVMVLLNLQVMTQHTESKLTRM